tara:strand:- start:172 stop:405 length:234 start_codon:yes stop_codon:yes gene_type:complete
MKVVPAISSIRGIPDYYSVYKRWITRWNKTGEPWALTQAHHYARVAVEMGQAIINDDETITIEIERPETGERVNDPQ